MLSEEQISRAFASIEENPFRLEALSWKYSVSYIDSLPRDILFRPNADITDEDRTNFKHHLEDSDEFLLISYHTSEQKSQALIGGGKVYNFVVSPISYECLWIGTGKWFA